MNSGSSVNFEALFLSEMSSLFMKSEDRRIVKLSRAKSTRMSQPLPFVKSKLNYYNHVFAMKKYT